MLLITGNFITGTYQSFTYSSRVFSYRKRCPDKLVVFCAGNLIDNCAVTEASTPKEPKLIVDPKDEIEEQKKEATEASVPKLIVDPKEEIEDETKETKENACREGKKR